MSTLADFSQWLLDRIQDSDNLLTPTQRDHSIAEAVRTYSRHKPRQLVADLAGADSYDLSLPAAWVTDVSSIVSVEYPAGSRAPVMLERDTLMLYRTSSTTKLRFLSVTPATGDTARLTYTVPHSVTSATSTIPTNDEGAVANLSAAEACEWLSTHFSQQGDTTLTADTVDHKSKATEFALRAKAFRNLAFDHLGIARTGRGGEASPRVKAASAVREWDTDLSNGRGDRLTHPGKYR